VKALQSAAFLRYLHRQEKAHGPTLFGRAGWYSQAGTGPSSYTVGADDTYGPYVQAAWATFNTTIPSQQKMPVSRIESWHRAWEGAMGRVPAGPPNAFAVVSGDKNNLYSVMALVEELLKSSVSGIAISLGLAYFTLIVSTRNLIIATMAIVSIIGIIITVFFTMVVIGWEISIIESVCMIVVVGMSVDYTVHLMHSYHESDLPNRFERGRAALTEMGVSVLSGAVTTFCASCPLLGATFLFFVRFGTFIAIITVYSIVWGVFFLMALALTVGPEVNPDTKLLKGEITLSLCRGSGKQGGSALVCDGDSEGEVHGSSDEEAKTEASSVEVRALQTDQQAESADEERVQQANPNRTQV
jgi:hypothetical protein